MRIRPQASRLVRQSTPTCRLRAQTASQRRLFHSTPQLAELALPELHTKEIDDRLKREGITNLYSPDGFDTAWTQYHTSLLQRINTITKGTQLSSSRPKELLAQTARDPDLAHIFNHASMAWNNHFYFNGILTQVSEHGASDAEKLDPSEPQHLPLFADLRADLQNSFGSIDTLRDTMIETADAMFGPGFVWLVTVNSSSTRRERSFKLLTTYNAGSPLPEAHWRLQPADQNTQYSNAEGTAGSFGSYSRAPSALSTAAMDLLPVLCVNTWEHAWQPDFGILGKRDFLHSWWDRIDWKTVSDRARGVQTEGTRRPEGLESQRPHGIS